MRNNASKVQPRPRLSRFTKRNTDFTVSFAIRHGNVHLAVLKNEARSGPSGRRMELIVNDEQAVEQQNYARAIEILLQRYQRLNLKHAPTQVVLSPRLVSQTTVDKPALSDDEIALALPWTLKDLIDIPAGDMVADFYESPVQFVGREKIQAVAVQKSWLTQVLQPLHAAKLAVRGVVNEDIALCALLGPEQATTVVVSQYEQQQAQLLLVKDNGLVVSRQLKPLQSVLDGSQIDNLEVEDLAIELQRSLDYFSGQLRQAPLQQALLAVPGNHSAEVGAHLQQSLSLQVGALQYPPWAANLAAGDYGDLGVLSGLAYLLPELQPQDGTAYRNSRVNLYSAALQPKKVYFSFANTGILVIGLLVVMALLRAGIAWQQSTVEQQRHATQTKILELQQQFGDLAAVARERRVDPQLQQLVADMERELRALQSLSHAIQRSDELGDDNYGRLLRDLSAIHQHGLWLSHIENRGGRLILRGHTEHSGHLPRWMARFNNVPSLAGRQFAVVSLEREEQELLSFEVRSQREQEAP